MNIKFSRIAALGTLLLMAGVPVHAEDTARDYDRFDIRFGGGWVFGANTDVTLLGARGVGTVIDFDKTLAGDRSDTFYKTEGTWRMAEKHSLNFSWYDVTRKGRRVLNQDVDFGDQTFTAGADISSKLDISLYRLLYRYG